MGSDTRQPYIVRRPQKINGATLPGPGLSRKHAPHTGARPASPARVAKDRPSHTIWDVNAPPLLHRRCGGHPFNLSRAFTVPVYRPEMAPGTKKPGRPPPRRQPTGLSSVPWLRRAR
ncbi:hypothetical protein GCM10010264_09070 [Streptomyces globisporus]|nr:hypothetical protein GCM10010264_09070 [Streptomyces globisporus]